MSKAGKVLLPGLAVAVIVVVAIALAGSHVLRVKPAAGKLNAGPSVPTYRDCADVDAAGAHLCPLLTTVPAGHFAMGTKAGEGEENEHPRHDVTIGKPLAVAVDLVTRGQYQACVKAGVCARPGKSEFRQDDSHPVVMISFKEAQAYTGWLSQKTGKHYRLPSEAEWEYFSRAGSTSAFPWGDSVGSKNANCGDCGSPWDNRSTAPVGSFSANAFGLHDTVGNAWQWVADCYHDSYAGAPADGSAWEAVGDCSLRPRRGGAWNESSHDSRSSARVGVYATARNNDFGFRVVRDE